MRRVSSDESRSPPRLEIVDVLRHNVAVDDQDAAPVDHDGDHVDGVHLRVGELQRCLATLDIEGKYLGVGRRQNVLLARDLDRPAIAGHVVPATHADIQIDAHSRQVRNVVLADVRNQGARVLRHETRVQRRVRFGKVVLLES